MELELVVISLLDEYMAVRVTGHEGFNGAIGNYDSVDSRNVWGGWKVHVSTPLHVKWRVNLPSLQELFCY